MGVRLKSQPELHASVGQEFLHLSPSSVELPPQGTYEEIVDTLGKRRPLKTATADQCLHGVRSNPLGA